MPRSYFSRSELDCPCCGIHNIQQEALDKLNEVREILGHPLFLNSACRCPSYNKKVGGASRSQHITTKEKPGKAFDVSIYWKDRGKMKEIPIADLVAAAEKAGFKGIGVYKSFVHLDNRRRRARW